MSRKTKAPLAESANGTLETVKVESVKIGNQEGYDPKNRVVTLSVEGTKITVEKSSTGFKRVFTAKQSVGALKYFDFLVNCSQN